MLPYLRLISASGDAILPLREMLTHPNNLSVTLRLAFVPLLVALCSSRVFALKEPDSVMVKIYRDECIVAPYRAFP